MEIAKVNQYKIAFDSSLKTLLTEPDKSDKGKKIIRRKEEFIRDMKPAGKILGFREEGLKGLHFYIKGLEFPVVAAEYSERDKGMFRYLDTEVKEGRMNSEEICQWCISHKIYFSLLYGIRRWHVFRNPGKTWRFLQMRVRLKNYAVRQEYQTASSM